MVYVIHILLTACEQYPACKLSEKPVWHIPLLCVQWKSPDDGHRNCLKYVEFYSKNKFEKLVHLAGFIIRTIVSCFWPRVTWFLTACFMFVQSFLRSSILPFALFPYCTFLYPLKYLLFCLLSVFVTFFLCIFHEIKSPIRNWDYQPQEILEARREHHEYATHLQTDFDLHNKIAETNFSFQLSPFICRAHLDGTELCFQCYGEES